MVTDLDCVTACCNTYFNPKAFDHWFDGTNTNQIVLGLNVYSDSILIAFRGSSNFLDWIRDFEAELIKTNIGGVEKGFYTGLPQTLNVILPFLDKTKTIILTGHSLGGGRAHLFAALLIKLGYIVSVTTFGSPRPGDQSLADILKQYPNKEYKNGPDYVTDVPIPIPPLLNYVHPSTLIPIESIPVSNDRWGLMAYHHIELYSEGLQKLFQGQ